LRQAGWVIVFDRYRSFDGIDLPVRLTASRDDARVRLAVRQWRFSHGAGGGG
jgi:outer membrane biogenesis lipoprotein LolB